MTHQHNSTSTAYQSFSIDAAIKFANSWGDEATIDRLRKSDKSKDVQKAEIENLLKSIAMRFERSPQANTLSLWAQDIVEAGYEDWMVKEISKSIPFKFERHPTLSQVMELLRPYIAQVSVSESELDKYTKLAIPHLKGKFVGIIGEDGFTKMIEYYRREVMPSSNFSVEMCMLGDWCRCFFTSDPKKIIDQGIKSNEASTRNDVDYFVRPLKMYSESNKLG